ncbi:MAG: YggS family pyridoxal phosphate-dependent enzyme [Desulfosoma sp.]
MSVLKANLAQIHRSLEEACRRSGRDVHSIRLIAVTKQVPVEKIREAAAVGLRLFGENYVQEGSRKIEALNDLSLEWHFIGHLQTNKVKAALQKFDWIQTVDRLSLARELDKRGGALGKRVPVLLQVHLGDEETKGGVAPDDLESLFKSVQIMEWLDVRGLMAVPPYFEDPEAVRPFFRSLRQWLERLRQQALHPERLTELSMGMSHDFHVAVEEGATLIRVGTALFGPRPSKPSASLSP